MNCLKLDPDVRSQLLENISRTYDQYLNLSPTKPSLPEYSEEKIRDFLKEFDFKNGGDASQIVKAMQKALEFGSLNFHHPKYFGVFNPSSDDMGSIGNYLASIYNPQLASRKSAPLAIAMESFLLSFFGEKAGYSYIEGNFTTGGTEANLTGMICALNYKFPSFSEGGVLSCEGRPMVYLSSETHHSFQKAAKTLGLGLSSIREVKVGLDSKVDIVELKKMIKEDKEKGLLPTMLVGSLGSTSSGQIDPMQELSEIARNENMWFHIDAAYGGGLLLIEQNPYLMALSDSFSFDAHKLLSMPFGCSLFITQQKGILRKSFSTEANVYMPSSSEKSESYEPYRDSLQWSRRFIGLSLFLALAHKGEKGLANNLKKQINLANVFRQVLQNHGFKILNKTPLPVICFEGPIQKKNDALEAIVRSVNDELGAYLTTTRLVGLGRKVLRVNVNNTLSNLKDFKDLAGCIKKNYTYL